MPILRCVFWLMVVYAAILSHGTFRFDAPAAVDVARAEAKDVIVQASAGATAYCTRHAGTCLDDAARLTALFAVADGQTADDQVAEGQALAKDVLVPRAAPRYGRRDAKLTRRP